MNVRIVKPFDLSFILSKASEEAFLDMKVFGEDEKILKGKAIEAYPFVWSVVGADYVPQCIFWFNKISDKAVTSMYYTKDFLQNKGITETIKEVIENNRSIIKAGGISKLECHSHLLNPLSEPWYLRLGFMKTNKTYEQNGFKITVFERIL